MADLPKLVKSDQAAADHAIDFEAPADAPDSTLRYARPMISHLDIFRSAAVLIREHGGNASLEAAQRTDAMLEKGDVESAAVWRRIVKAVEEIQHQDRRPGEP